MNSVMAAEWLEKAVREDDSGKSGVMFAHGDTVPSDGVDGYATGCQFVKDDNTDHTDCLYVNIGDADSANFNVVTIASD